MNLVRRTILLTVAVAFLAWQTASAAKPDFQLPPGALLKPFPGVQPIPGKFIKPIPKPPGKPPGKPQPPKPPKPGKPGAGKPSWPFPPKWPTPPKPHPWPHPWPHPQPHPWPHPWPQPHPQPHPQPMPMPIDPNFDPDLRPHRELLIINDNDVDIRFRLNGDPVEMGPGEKIELPAGRPWHVEFHRGGHFGHAERELIDGAYVFVRTGEGWDLVRPIPYGPHRGGPHDPSPLPENPW